MSRLHSVQSQLCSVCTNSVVSAWFQPPLVIGTPSNRPFLEAFDGRGVLVRSAYSKIPQRTNGLLSLDQRVPTRRYGDAIPRMSGPGTTLLARKSFRGLQSFFFKIDKTQ